MEGKEVSKEKSKMKGCTGGKLGGNEEGKSGNMTEVDSPHLPFTNAYKEREKESK